MNFSSFRIRNNTSLPDNVDIGSDDDDDDDDDEKAE